MGLRARGRRHEHRVGDVALRAAQPSAGSRPRKCSGLVAHRQVRAATALPQPGDTQLVGYECSLDSAAYAACTSPASQPPWPTARTPSASGASTPPAARPRRQRWRGRSAQPTPAPTPTPTPTPMPRRDARAPPPTRAPTAPPACVGPRAMRLHWTVPERSRLGAFAAVSAPTVARSRPSAATRRAYTLSLRGRAAQKVTVRISARGTRRRQVRHHTGLHDVRRAAEARHARDAVGSPYALRVSAPA